MKLLNIVIFIILCSCAHQESYKNIKGVKLAVSRYQIEGGLSVKEYLNKIEKEVEFASDNKAKYLFLAELNSLDLFSKNPTDIEKEIKFTTDLAPILEQGLIKIAQKYKVNIIGSSHFVKINKSIFNRAYFINVDGTLAYQDKIYPTPWEKKNHISEGSVIKAFKAEDFNFVILICHDTEFSDISEKIKALKPEVIFVPSQTDDQSGRERVRSTAKARAIEHMSYVLLNGASGVKNATWHDFVGGASFYWPQNKYFPLGELNNSKASTPLIIELDLPRLRKARSDKDQVYPARDSLKRESKIRILSL